MHTIHKCHGYWEIVTKVVRDSQGNETVFDVDFESIQVMAVVGILQKIRIKLEQVSFRLRWEMQRQEATTIQMKISIRVASI